MTAQLIDTNFKRDAGTGGGLGSTVGGGVFKSTDRGETWSARNAGLRSLSINALGINRSTPSVIHAATSGGLYRSGDAGASWIAEYCKCCGFGNAGRPPPNVGEYH